MKNLNKKLAYGLWAVCGINILIYVISIIDYNSHLDAITIVKGIAKPIITFIFQFLLGYTILKDKNNKLTMISVIIIVILGFNIDDILIDITDGSLDFAVNTLLNSIGSNISYIIAIILRLVIRKKKETEGIRKAWFIPAVVFGVTWLIPIFINYFAYNIGFHLFPFIYLMLDVAYYLIFGYWLIKYLKVD